MIIDKKQAAFIFSFALVNVAASLGVFFFKEYYRKTHPIIKVKEESEKEENGIICVETQEKFSFLDKFKPDKMGKIAKTVAYKKLMDELEKRDVTITISFLKE